MRHPVCCVHSVQHAFSHAAEFPLRAQTSQTQFCKMLINLQVHLQTPGVNSSPGKQRVIRDRGVEWMAILRKFNLDMESISADTTGLQCYFGDIVCRFRRSPVLAVGLICIAIGQRGLGLLLQTFFKDLHK